MRTEDKINDCLDEAIELLKKAWRLSKSSNRREYINGAINRAEVALIESEPESESFIDFLSSVCEY